MNKAAHLAASGLTFPAGVIVMMAVGTIENLRARQQELQAEAEAIVNAADEEGRDLTEDELESVQASKTEIDKLSKQIAAREAIQITNGPGRRTAPEPSNGPATGPRQTIAPTPRNSDPRHGFRNFGEFAKTVMDAGSRNESALTRMSNVASTYGNEGAGADGGFLVPPEFRRSIWQKVMNEDNLLTRCEQLVTGSNSMVVPKDETTPWQTSGGIQVYWESEAAQATQSKPALETTTMRLNKLLGLVPITDELREDAPGLESWLNAKAPAKMVSAINTAIVSGNGVGKPLGILSAPSLVTVAKENSQAADTIVFNNISKIWSRMYAPCRRNAVWLINQDIEPQLDALAFPGTGTAVPVYLPAGGLSTSPYATLKGRPVIPVEACKTLGDLGDIILVDLSQYYALTKGQDIKTDVSMHLFFDQAITAFRFMFRVTGQPAWGSSITPQNGNSTRSWAVALAERA
ncbi:phage major capsid protein [Azospirillum himalayense]|uniref:Phage major capsid protein n=1 Tax=Azospirillum himalayense TaxID=654847 RepID=A0ABW0FZW9_9PROT